MIIVIDLDLQQAVQSFGSRTPTNPIQVKSQDTPTMALYFAKGAINFDLGASPGLRFGLFTAGNPNSLVNSVTFTRTTDVQQRTCYVGYPNFNTTALVGAIGTNDSIDLFGEIRYQTTFGTIARTADIPFTVARSLLNETIIDNTTAAFITPAVGSTVSVAISSTTWLKSGLILSIGAGAGNYTVTTITDATHFVAQNNGGTGNAAAGTSIPVGTTVGIAPATIISTYPDPSVIEVTTHKGVANGYAGLDANTLLLASRIPVDGQTISALPSGKIGLSSILATVATNFTTPAANANVSVTLSSTANLVAGQYVRIPIAGYYIVESVTSGTVAVLQNNGDPFNSASGVTITTGAVILPAQAAAGGGGGTPGQNAFTTITASFTVPAAGATVSVTMGSTAWLGGSGYVVFIANAGYYALSSVTDATHAVLTNLGYATTNAGSGTTIPNGSQVSPGGIQGAASTATGANAYDTTATSFIMPAAAANVNITISNTGWLGVGQIVYVAGAGYFTISSITSATIFNASNANYPGAAAPGTTIASGAHVSPAGLIGPAGAGGAGLNAFTSVSASYTQPAQTANVTITVGTTAWMALGQIIYVASGGYYSINSIGDLTHVTVTNLGYLGNASSGATVSSGGAVSPAGLIGPAGSTPYTTTTVSFTMPAIGSSVTVNVGTTAFMAAGQNVYASGAGYFTIATVTDASHVVLTNNGATGNATSGAVIGSGASVTTAGANGQTGAAGAPGPAGRDGAYSTIYTQFSLTGTGGSATPAQLVNDSAQGTNPYYTYQRNASGNSLWAAALLSAADAVGAPSGGEVSQIQSQTNGVLALKKLKTGTTGSVVLTDQGGSTGDILVDVPVDGTTIQVSGGHLVATGGGGGGGAFNPQGASGGVYLYEDFIWNQLDNIRWQTGTSGSPAATAQTAYGYNSTLKAQGVYELSSGTATANTVNGYTLVNGYAGSAGAGIASGLVLGAGTLDIAFRLAQEESSLPPTGVGYVARIGLMNQNSAPSSAFPAFGSALGTNAGTSAIVLEYSPDNNSGNFRIGYLYNAGAVSYTNCTAAPTANTFNWWELKITSAGVVTAYFNATSIGSVTVSSSLLGIPLVPYVVFWRSNAAGTNFHLAVDTYYLSYPYNR